MTKKKTKKAKMSDKCHFGSLFRHLTEIGRPTGPIPSYLRYSHRNKSPWPSSERIFLKSLKRVEFEFLLHNSSSSLIGFTYLTRHESGVFDPNSKGMGEVYSSFLPLKSHFSFIFVTSIYKYIPRRAFTSSSAGLKRHSPVLQVREQTPPHRITWIENFI